MDNLTSNSISVRPFLLFSKKCSKFFLSNLAYWAYFLLACFIVLTQSEVVGAVIFVLIISVLLVICDDLMATTLPFLLLCVFVTRCYDSFNVFIKFAPVAIPVLFSLVFHFVYYKKELIIGKSFNGLIAVSISLIVGGIGYISPSDYFKPSSLFYVSFLGIGMVVFYLLFKSHTNTVRIYTLKKKLISIFYITGALACVVALFIDYLSRSGYKSEYLIWQPGNNLSTFLLFALPCPFYFAKRNILHIIPAFLFYFCIIVSRSRGGVLMGTILLLICLITYAIFDKKHRLIYVIILILLSFLLLVLSDDIIKMLNYESFSSFFNINDPRVQMMKRGLGNFSKYPIFGHGLGHTGNADIYNPVKGAMEWYHMMIPQIVAGLGIIGVLAYGYQFYLRCKITLISLKSNTGNNRVATVTLFLSYLGVLLMSQVNPGLFCPFPYSIMAVMIFTLLEEDPPIKISKIKR